MDEAVIDDCVVAYGHMRSEYLRLVTDYVVLHRAISMDGFVYPLDIYKQYIH